MRRLLFVFALSLRSAFAGPDCVVTFNEIHYAPAAGEPEWVELYNQFSIPVDVGGWRLAGGMDFTIPDGTVMAPGAFLLISKTAGTPSGSLGPFTGILDNAGEELRLNTRHGRLMDRVIYDNTGAWPVLPEGFTLAKVSPFHASGPPDSWAAAIQAGGTPGAVNFAAPPDTAAAAQRIAFTGGSYWKYAPGVAAPAPDWTAPGFRDAAWPEGPGILASGPVGGVNPATLLPSATAHYFRKAFVLPPGIHQPQLILSGVLRGEAWVYLDGSLVAQLSVQDGPFSRLINTPALTLGTHQLAVKTASALNSFADGWDASLALVTPDASLPPPAAPLTGTVVLNEILYHKRPHYRSTVPAASYAENAEEFIELHNTGAAAVDLSGWKFTDAVSYTFPGGSTIPAGGFLVVNQPQFNGSLGDGGERLRLRDAADALVDEVAWADGGRWPEAADGGGVSMELTDPRADNAKPEAWAASIEDAPWQTITYRASGAEPPGTNNPDTWRECLFGLLDAGEVLVDDIRVTEDPDGVPVPLIQNGTFENDTIGQAPVKWRCLGTHKKSIVVADPAGAGKVLKITATGELEHT